MSVLRLFLCLLCLHNENRVTTSASPRNPPSPAPKPTSRFNVDDDADADGDVDANVVAVDLEVAVAVVVNEVVFVLSTNVEVDWLIITGPESIANGDLLPFVLLSQLLLDDCAWPQQNRL